MYDNKLHPKHEITIKGLVYNDKGELLFLKDDGGKWDLPGGRMDHMETVLQTLSREIREEMGVVVKSVEPRPHFAEAILFEAPHEFRFAVGYKIQLSSREFENTAENRESKFISATEFDQLNFVYPGMKDIKHL